MRNAVDAFRDKSEAYVQRCFIGRNKLVGKKRKLEAIEDWRILPGQM